MTATWVSRKGPIKGSSLLKEAPSCPYPSEEKDTVRRETRDLWGRPAHEGTADRERAIATGRTVLQLKLLVCRGKNSWGSPPLMTAGTGAHFCCTSSDFSTIPQLTARHLFSCSHVHIHVSVYKCQRLCAVSIHVSTSLRAWERTAIPQPDASFQASHGRSERGSPTLHLHSSSPC